MNHTFTARLAAGRLSSKKIRGKTRCRAPYRENRGWDGAPGGGLAFTAMPGGSRCRQRIMVQHTLPIRHRAESVASPYEVLRRLIGRGKYKWHSTRLVRPGVQAVQGLSTPLKITAPKLERKEAAWTPWTPRRRRSGCCAQRTDGDGPHRLADAHRATGLAQCGAVE